MNGLQQKKALLRAQVKPLASKVQVDVSLLRARLPEKAFDCVGLYQPLKDEPEVKGFPDKQKVCWPKITDLAKSQMEFFESTGFQKSQYGFLEPEEESLLVLKQQISMILVPGLAFDTKGFRLGRGKGFYDRYLQGFDGVTVGVCSACLLYTSPSPRDQRGSRMPSSA